MGRRRHHRRRHPLTLVAGVCCCVVLLIGLAMHSCGAAAEVAPSHAQEEQGRDGVLEHDLDVADSAETLGEVGAATSEPAPPPPPSAHVPDPADTTVSVEQDAPSEKIAHGFDDELEAAEAALDDYDDVMLHHEGSMQGAGSLDDDGLLDLTFEEWQQSLERVSEEFTEIPEVVLSNYASSSCGSKIVAMSKHIQKASAVLSSNPDQYLNTPCNVDTWFVVELCEAVIVQKFTVATYELFASIPHKISLSVAERYPTADWEEIGIITTEDVRTEQSFLLPTNHFSKFVKIQVLEHVGNEYYCPISHIGIYGVTLLEEFEYLTKPDHEKITAPALPEADENEPSEAETKDSASLAGALKKGLRSVTEMFMGEVSLGSAAPASPSTAAPSDGEKTTRKDAHGHEAMEKNAKDDASKPLQGEDDPTNVHNGTRQHVDPANHTHVDASVNPGTTELGDNDSSDASVDETAASCNTSEPCEDLTSSAQREGSDNDEDATISNASVSSKDSGACETAEVRASAVSPEEDRGNEKTSAADDIQSANSEQPIILEQEPLPSSAVTPSNGEVPASDPAQPELDALHKDDSEAATDTDDVTRDLHDASTKASEENKSLQEQNGEQQQEAPQSPDDTALGESLPAMDIDPPKDVAGTNGDAVSSVTTSDEGASSGSGAADSLQTPSDTKDEPQHARQSFTLTRLSNTSSVGREGVPSLSLNVSSVAVDEDTAEGLVPSIVSSHVPETEFVKDYLDDEDEFEGELPRGSVQQLPLDAEPMSPPLRRTASKAEKVEEDSSGVSPSASETNNESPPHSPHARPADERSDAQGIGKRNATLVRDGNATGIVDNTTLLLQPPGALEPSAAVPSPNGDSDSDSEICSESGNDHCVSSQQAAPAKSTVPSPPPPPPPPPPLMPAAREDDPSSNANSDLPSPTLVSEAGAAGRADAVDSDLPGTESLRVEEAQQHEAGTGPQLPLRTTLVTDNEAFVPNATVVVIASSAENEANADFPKAPSVSNDSSSEAVERPATVLPPGVVSAPLPPSSQPATPPLSSQVPNPPTSGESGTLSGSNILGSVRTKSSFLNQLHNTIQELERQLSQTRKYLHKLSEHTKRLETQTRENVTQIVVQLEDVVVLLGTISERVDALEQGEGPLAVRVKEMEEALERLYHLMVILVACTFAFIGFIVVALSALFLCRRFYLLSSSRPPSPRQPPQLQKPPKKKPKQRRNPI